MTQVKLKIKKGDTVKVLSGKDKGKTGKVLRVYPERMKVIVDNINMHTKFERSKKAGQPGQRITVSSPMGVSKLMLIDPSTNKPSRIGYKVMEDGKKQRIAKKSQKAV